MKGFRDHIDDIHRNFTMGFMPKKLAIHNFEHVLKNYNLMPREDELDSSMTDEEFLWLLSEAQELQVKREPKIEPEVERRDLVGAGQMPAERHYFNELKGTLGGRTCPICGKQKEVYSSIQDETHRVWPVQPPRCEECMWEWAEKNIINPYIPDTKMRPMNQEDYDFFRKYEEQMKGTSIK